jgi:GH3 auxin-responsive promoter
LDHSAASGFPTLSTHFFEFVPRQAWEAGSRQCWRLGELEVNEEYYVIVTTPSGLYRYFINDVVRVTGFFARTPLLQFIQKGRGVTNITGEKLYEGQVIKAVNGVLDEARVASSYYLLLADEEGGAYRFYLEAAEAIEVSSLLARIDEQLRAQNVEYDAKRESGRLLLPVGHLLRDGTLEQFRQHCVARGQREAQFKAPALAYTRDIPFDFDQCTRT